MPPSRALLWLYALVAAGHVVFIHLEWTVAVWVTKPMLTLVLIGYVVARRVPAYGPVLVAALAAACVGDIVLLFGTAATFAGGIALFAVTQVLYLKVLRGVGAFRALAAKPAVLAAYGVALVALLWWLLPRVDRRWPCSSEPTGCCWSGSPPARPARGGGRASAAWSSPCRTPRSRYVPSPASRRRPGRS